MAPSSRFGAGDGRAHGRTEPGRTYQVSKRNAKRSLAQREAFARASRWPGRTVAVPDTLRAMPPTAIHGGRLLVLAAVLVAVIACSGAAPSFDPTGACTTDEKAPGAYPELEARLPTTYRGDAPSTVDSGRNCSAEALGPLAELGFREVRFAGATWTFGAERALVLAVFSAPGLEVADVAEFYEESARTSPRMEILEKAEPTIAGRQGWRLDAKRVERLQTVVVWPASDPDVVNVVISNDLPDARIAEAVDAFGDR